MFLPVRLLSATLAFGVLLPAIANARAIPPPGMFLFRPEHVVVAAVVEARPGAGTLELRITETLSGHAESQRIVVNSSPAWLVDVRKGAHVLVGFTPYQRSQFQPKAVELRPEGPVIVSSTGLEPALFSDTPQARALIAAAHETSRNRSSAPLAQIIRGLGSDDRQIQNFCAAELSLRVELQQNLGNAERKQIADFLVDSSTHPAARALLLRAAAAAPDQFGADWPLVSALAILDSTPVDSVEAPPGFMPNLVYTAFEVLERAHRDVPLATAQRWVYSGHAALMEAALLSIRRSEPDAERRIAEQALESSTLSAPGREFLRDHLRRLGLMRDALATSQHPEGTRSKH